jgi:DNA-binding PadR family transcriptional regulator
MLRYIVLGILRTGPSQHGYGIIKTYRRRSGVSGNTGSVYRELRRLQSEGLIRMAKDDTSKRSRCAPYEITQAGIAEFDTWLHGSTMTKADRKHDNGISQRAMFLTHAGKETATELLGNWQRELWFQCKVIERARRAAVQQDQVRPGLPFSPLPLLLARRLRHLAAELEFLDELQAAYSLWSKRSSRLAPAKPGGRRAKRVTSQRSTAGRYRSSRGSGSAAGVAPPSVDSTACWGTSSNAAPNNPSIVAPRARQIARA